jgi:predicted transglutaminase-like cysteine proteinase
MTVNPIANGATVAPVLSLQPNADLIPASTAIPSGAAAIPPDGFVAFCRRVPDQCQETKDAAPVAALNPTVWRTLWQVNMAWNTAVKPMDDAAHYGRVDYWTIPTDGYGNCHDYALAKRKSLIDLGLPEQALRIAVVRTEDGTAHAVLDIVTDHGDYVLDNLDSVILPWTATPYIWIARQVSGENQWAYIGPSQVGDQIIATADITPQ